MGIVTAAGNLFGRPPDQSDPGGARLGILTVVSCKPEQTVRKVIKEVPSWE